MFPPKPSAKFITRGGRGVPYDVDGYQAYEAGGEMEFWDSDDRLFTVPTAAA